MMIQTDKLTILENSILPIQIGRTYVEMKIYTPWYYNFVCCSNEKNLVKDYQMLNAKKISIESDLNIKIQESFNNNKGTDLNNEEILDSSKPFNLEVKKN